MDTEFWLGKRVFLTGHTGFKGSWLSVVLSMLGAHVTGYSLSPPTSPSLFELADVKQDVDSHIGDIRDADHLHSVFQACDPEIVIHMAAQPIVRWSYKQPTYTYETNIMGTVHLLEAARSSASVRSVLVVTSDKCYGGAKKWGSYHETDAMGGDDPYSCSKGCAELITNSYYRSFFQRSRNVGIATGRAGNVIGGGDWGEDRIIPDFVRTITNGKPLQVRNPDATRPWQHVLDPLFGYLVLLENLYHDPSSYSGGWNFGPDEDSVCTVAELADKLVSAWGDGAAWQAKPEKTDAVESIWLSLDPSKARKQLGWKVLLDTDEAIKLSMEWYKGYRAEADMRLATRSQVSDYLRRMADA